MLAVFVFEAASRLYLTIIESISVQGKLVNDQIVEKAPREDRMTKAVLLLYFAGLCRLSHRIPWVRWLFHEFGFSVLQAVYAYLRPNQPFGRADKIYV
jgi:hypothetical protein